MPAKNSVKQYAEDGIYHVYNRGVEKRLIFLEDRDYKTFLYFLKFYLSPEEKVNPKTKIPNLMNLSDEVSLLAYCLMPNHFHLLIQQKKRDSMVKLMRRVNTNYVMFFNDSNRRVGPLFQGVYKAILIETDEQLLHVNRYIHRNPLDLVRVEPSRGFNPHAELLRYPYSSYRDYLGRRSTSWVKPTPILSIFGNTNAPLTHRYRSYQSFMEETDEETIHSNTYLNFFIDSEDPK